MSRRKSLVLIIPSLCFAIWGPMAAAQSGAPGGKSLTDSPYKDGPPPVSGGYTDTSQGGSHTSGDMPLPPQAQGASTTTGGQAQKQQAEPHQPNPQGAKPAAAGGSPG
jgi:hypothetical protein